MAFSRILPYTHSLLALRLKDGGYAIDATAGNGHDTLFMAKRVGKGGHLWSFDIQASAIDASRTSIVKQGLLNRVTFENCGHERMASRLPLEIHGRVAAVSFNLGYLPGGDRSVVTKPDTTIQALDQALQLLGPEGLVTIVVYRGHPGGKEEAQIITRWAGTLPSRKYNVLSYQQINRENSPGLIAVQKIGKKSE